MVIGIILAVAVQQIAQPVRDATIVQRQEFLAESAALLRLTTVANVQVGPRVNRQDFVRADILAMSSGFQAAYST
jgi:hypothetical protein